MRRTWCGSLAVNGWRGSDVGGGFKKTAPRTLSYSNKGKVRRVLGREIQKNAAHTAQ